MEGLRCPTAPGAAGAVRASPAHLTSAADLLASDLPSRCRRAGARAQRRGVSRARVLGRALRLPLPELPAARDHPGAADVSLPADRRGPGGGHRGRLSRSHVSVAERQRWRGANTGHPPQPPFGEMGSGPQPQPAPCERGDLLQRLALLPDHSRPRLPARPRRRDDARDRALLVLGRTLQRRPRPVGDPRRDGPRRVPRALSGRDRGRAAQQRVYQRDRGLDLRERRSSSTSSPQAAATCCAHGCA